MLDKDLAEVYGVATKRLNEQVKRNRRRFPVDFCFRLTEKESRSLQYSRSQSATLKWGQNIKYLPWAFTEHGALMAANVLNSRRAVEASVFVVRAFVRLRRMIATNAGLARKLRRLEARVKDHGFDIEQIFGIIERWVTSPSEPKRRIGFQFRV